MDDRISKLPKWAQDKIANLERDLADARRVADAGIFLAKSHPDNLWLERNHPAKFVDDWHASRFRGGRFMLGERWNDFIDFRMEATGMDRDQRFVYVHSGGSLLSVYPRSGNAVLLGMSR